MQCKRKVLAREPEAKLVVIRRWVDGSPRYIAVCVGEKRLDINEPDCGEGDYGDGRTQGPAAAWRSAHFFLVRRAGAGAEERMQTLMAPFSAEV
jgi:hypothetical protein